MELPRTRTPATREEIRAAVLRQGVTGRSADYLTALSWIETGGTRSMFGWNAGNVTVSRGQIAAGVDYWRPNWFEEPGPDASARIKYVHQEMLEGRAPEAFAAYPDLDAGVAAMVGIIRRRFPSMLEARTALEFSRAWHESGYAPDRTFDVEATARTIVQTVGPDPVGGTAPGSSFAMGVGALALGVWLWVRKRG